MNRYYCVACHSSYEGGGHQCKVASAPGVQAAATNIARSTSAQAVLQKDLQRSAPRITITEQKAAAKAAVRAAAPIVAAPTPGLKIKTMPVEQAKEEVLPKAPREAHTRAVRREVFTDGSFVRLLVCTFCSTAYGEERRTEHRIWPERDKQICRDCLN